MAPRFINSSSTRKGTTFVDPTSSSSPLVKPVTVLPSTRGLPFGVLRSAPEEWQTNAMVFGQGGFYQGYAVLVFGEIPHRPMTTGVEDGVEVLSPDAVEANRCREPRFCVCISFEPMRKVGLKVGLVAFRIERRLAALWRSEHMRGQNHQDLHQ